MIFLALDLFIVQMRLSAEVLCVERLAANWLSKFYSMWIILLDLREGEEVSDKEIGDKLEF